MNVRIAGRDRPVRAPGTLLSPMGLLPESDNAKWVGMLVSFSLGLILSTAHIAGSPAPFGLAFLAAMGSAPAAHCALSGVRSAILLLSASHPARSLQPGAA